MLQLYSTLVRFQPDALSAVWVNLSEKGCSCHEENATKTDPWGGRIGIGGEIVVCLVFTGVQKNKRECHRDLNILTRLAR